MFKHFFFGCYRYKEYPSDDGGTISECLDCGEQNCYHSFGPIEFTIDKQPKKE